LSRDLLRSPRFHELLLQIDRDFADRARQAGCPCGAALHSATYPRKPRGVVISEPEPRRLSFCCARDGCRRRVTPASVRFLGRRVYAGGVVVLAATMSSGITPYRAARLRELFGVGRDTLARWRKWWREAFVKTPFWRIARARLSSPIAPEELPACLLARFLGEDLMIQLVGLLRFIAPITTGPDGAGSLMAV
jgi:hypothetical protein